jgi:hypothetical protein
VTYGPFAPDPRGQSFPAPGRVRNDFERMQEAGINAIRTYHVPPEWLLEQAEEHRVRVLIDVPWSKHLCFLHGRRAREEARKAVQGAARLGGRFDAVLAYGIGNEIPADIVRWHGARRVERFLRELVDAARQVDPEGLVTYGNYPSTEYLELSFLDFATFNVYLHDRAVFRKYLFRLQNLLGDRPLVLGEIGMDSLRQGEAEQAAFLAGHLRETMLCGAAGAFVFSWTDDWHTGGHAIRDWAFGVTRADRTTKASYHELRPAFDRPLWMSLETVPKVSVVVCTYNGGRTLEECLRSLEALAYPDYEVIVVDDGSTDDTRTIVARFPAVRAIHQENRGLSEARNVGWQAADGAIVAYTDSDCFAEPDWLTHLVDQLERSGAAAVGGPNLSPADGPFAACVAASPGQPTHVLVDDQTAEHVPGCNMALRRTALEAINGFDPQFRTAGDDVDVCWRLQHEGYSITFAPGAIVWHHRRPSVRRYLAQQAGYGAAEGLLHFKHPDRFTRWGYGKWQGVVYGAASARLRLSAPIVYRGTFGNGMFQCLYRPSPAHLAMLPSTLEWHLAAALVLLGAWTLWPPLAWVAAAMLAAAVAVAALQAAQAPLPPRLSPGPARLVIAGLCYLQPLVRSWSRYRARLFACERPGPDPAAPPMLREGRPWLGTRTQAFWSEQGPDRIALLAKVIARLAERRFPTVLDSGWFDWDLGVSCQGGFILKVGTVQEDHGAGRRLIRVRYRLAFARWIVAAGLAGLLTAAAGRSPRAATVLTLLIVALAGHLWWRAGRLASRVVRMFEAEAAALGMAACPEDETRNRCEPPR